MQRGGASQPESAKAANDAERSAEHDDERPATTLSDAQRAHTMIIAAGRRLGDVRLPTWAKDHLDRMDGIVRCAWSDRDELAKVALGGHPATAAEISDFSLRIEVARETTADEAVPVNGATASNDPKPMSDEALDAEMRNCLIRLCDGLVPWFPFSRATPAEVERQRKAVQTVRRERARASLVTNDLLRFKVCSDTKILAWLRGLPKGEGALLERLGVLHHERVRRKKGVRSTATWPRRKTSPCARMRSRENRSSASQRRAATS